MAFFYNKVKKLLLNKYNIKNIEKIKTIIEWQVIKNIVISIIKTN